MVDPRVVPDHGSVCKRAWLFPLRRQGESACFQDIVYLGLIELTCGSVPGLAHVRDRCNGPHRDAWGIQPDVDHTPSQPTPLSMEHHFTGGVLRATHRSCALRDLVGKG